MTALESVRAALVADATVSAALDVRITPVVAPQNQPTPYAVLDVPHVKIVNHLGGFGGLDICEVSVQVWAQSFTASAATALACRRALEAAGFLCLEQMPDLKDDDIAPPEFGSGWVFQAFQ